jgi:hypothetical protein
LKLRIGRRKIAEQHKLNFRDQGGFIVKKYEHLGIKVDQMFPLLDPDLFWSDALPRHQNWYKNQNSFVTALSPSSQGERNGDLANETSFIDFCDRFPIVMPFIPTSSVMQRLIEKATQVKAKGEILYMLNPKERKRAVNELDLDEPVNDTF